MCRNIQPLHNFDPPVTEDDCHAAALQYVRKVSGMRSPSKANEAAFERAVAELTEITRRLVLEELVATGRPKSRDDVLAQAKERGRKREERMMQKVIDQLSMPKES